MQTNAVINDELQGTLVGYLRCGVIFNNHVKKGFVAESASEKGFKVGEHLAQLRVKRWIVLCTFFDFYQCGGGGQSYKVHETTTFLLVTLPDIH